MSTHKCILQIENYRMLFGNFLPEVRSEPERVRLIDGMLTDFRTAFPDLVFELRLIQRVVNAQAILLYGKCCVLIYGGLALHPRLAENSLMLVFLHEVGHHLASGPRLPFNLSLACECVADNWATGEGSDILYRKSGRRLQVGKALDELEGLMDVRQDSELRPEEQTSNCWQHKWMLRKKVLKATHAQSSISVCELFGPKM